MYRNSKPPNVLAFGTPRGKHRMSTSTSILFAGAYMAARYSICLALAHGWYGMTPRIGSIRRLATSPLLLAESEHVIRMSAGSQPVSMLSTDPPGYAALLQVPCRSGQPSAVFFGSMTWAGRALNGCLLRAVLICSHGASSFWIRGIC